MYDILLMFRLETIAITADFKQAFLQILLDKKDLNIIVYQFTRVVFSLISRRFLLNGTLKLYFTNFLFERFI